MTGTPSGRQILEGRIAATDRVLVLGAGGWFGSTLLDLLGPLVTPAQVLCIARDPRLHVVGGWTWELEAWEESRVQSFAPTIVLNFAFLTRGFAAGMGADEYESTNSELTRRYIYAATLPTVRLAFTASSGAAATEQDHSYGRLKLVEEQSTLALASDTRAAIVARAYSVSGPYVRRPSEYAFSSFVEQAGSGRIRVTADRPTFRRYTDAGEFLALCIRRGLDGYSGVIESGGELVEMGELAQRIATASRGAVFVERAMPITEEPSTYASDNELWQRHCKIVGFVPSTLDEQVSIAMREEQSETKPSG